MDNRVSESSITFIGDIFCKIDLVTTVYMVTGNQSIHPVQYLLLSFANLIDYFFKGQHLSIAAVWCYPIVWIDCFICRIEFYQLTGKMWIFVEVLFTHISRAKCKNKRIYVKFSTYQTTLIFIYSKQLTDITTDPLQITKYLSSAVI